VWRAGSVFMCSPLSSGQTNLILGELGYVSPGRRAQRSKTWASPVVFGVRARPFWQDWMGMWSWNSN